MPSLGSLFKRSVPSPAATAPSPAAAVPSPAAPSPAAAAPSPAAPSPAAAAPSPAAAAPSPAAAGSKIGADRAEQLRNKMQETGFKGAMYKPNKASDVMFEIYVNNMLFQPHTPILNALSNMFNVIAVAPLDTAFRAGVTTFNKPEDKTYYREVIADIYGLMHGFMQGTKFAGGRLKTMLPGQTETSVQTGKRLGLAPELFSQNKLDLASRAVDSRNLGVDPESLLGKITDGLGALINIPGSVLNGTDEMAKIVTDTRLRSRWAAHKVITGEASDFKTAWKSMIDDPNVAKAAVQEAEHYTYMGKLQTAPLSWITDTAMEKLPFLRWVIPFKRSIANIAEQTFERSPLVLAMPSLRKKLTSSDPIERATAQSRLLTGVTLTATLGYMLRDNLRGEAPRDTVQRDLWESVYGKADSMVFADGSIELDNAGVIGQLLKVVARYNQWSANRRDSKMIWDPENPMSSDEMLQEFGQFVSPVVTTLFDTYWGKNLVELGSVVAMAVEQDSYKPLARYIESVAVKTMPIIGTGVSRQLAQGAYANKYTQTGDMLKMQMPGLSSLVRSSYAWDGHKRLVNRYKGPNSTFDENPYDPNNPMTKYMADIKVSIRRPSDYFSATFGAANDKRMGLGNIKLTDAPTIQLTDAEWDKYNTLHATGIPERGIPPISQRLEGVVTSKIMKMLPKEMHKKAIETAIAEYRKELRDYMKSDPNMAQRIIKARKLQRAEVDSTIRTNMRMSQ